MQYTKAIIILSHVPILAAVISALVLYKQLGRTLQAFCWFIFFSGAIQFTSLFFWFHRMNNFPLLHVYVAGGFVCLAWFYTRVLDQFIRPAIIWWTAILFVLLCAVNTVFFQPLLKFNSYTLVGEAALVIILSFFTFLFLLNHTIREAGVAEIRSLTWINSGLFIYFLSCFLIYYFSDIINAYFFLALRRFTWLFHSFFSIVMYCCFITGLWKRSKVPVS